MLNKINNKMKTISEIIKESDAYKQLENKGLIKEKSELDILFQSFGDIYQDMYNDKNLKK
tara:strand:- start:811 stop:990 length:180 start_codon:yes stop_codon:yes gene_type:complete